MSDGGVVAGAENVRELEVEGGRRLLKNHLE